MTIVLCHGPGVGKKLNCKKNIRCTKVRIQGALMHDRSNVTVSYVSYALNQPCIRKQAIDIRIADLEAFVRAYYKIDSEGGRSVTSGFSEQDYLRQVYLKDNMRAVVQAYLNAREELIFACNQF